MPDDDGRSNHKRIGIYGTGMERISYDIHGYRQLLVGIRFGNRRKCKIGTAKHSYRNSNRR